MIFRQKILSQLFRGTNGVYKFGAQKNRENNLPDVIFDLVIGDRLRWRHV